MTRIACKLRWCLWATVAGVALYALLAHPAMAASGFDLFDPLTQSADQQSRSWMSTILGLVRPTFLLLATIEICWAAAIWAFEKDSLNSLAVEIIKKIMFIGFFFSLLQFAPDWIPALVSSFQAVGQAAGGVDTNTLSTDSIIATGLSQAGKLFGATIGTAIPLWSVPQEAFGNSIPGAFVAPATATLEMTICGYVCIGVVISYVIVAAQFFTLKLESSVLIAAGAVFLGLGSSSWTKEYVSKYLNYAMNVGVRFLVLILVLSITLKAVANLPVAPSLDIVDTMKLLAAAILQAILGMKAPEMAGALLSGGVGLSAGSAAQGARSGMGMTMGVAGKLASAAQGASNLAKAVSAGRDLARQEGKSGAAAALGGLGAAAGETARSLPGKLMDTIKGKSGGGAPGTGYGAGGGALGRGQNPGLFDTAKQNLRARANDMGQPGGSVGAGSSGVGAGGDESTGGKPGSSDGVQFDSGSTAAAERTPPPSYREGAPSPTFDGEAISIVDDAAGVAPSSPLASAVPTLSRADVSAVSAAVARPTSLKRATGASRNGQPQSPSPSPGHDLGPGPSGNT